MNKLNYIFAVVLIIYSGCVTGQVNDKAPEADGNKKPEEMVPLSAVQGASPLPSLRRPENSTSRAHSRRFASRNSSTGISDSDSSAARISLIRISCTSAGLEHAASCDAIRSGTVSNASLVILQIRITAS